MTTGPCDPVPDGPPATTPAPGDVGRAGGRLARLVPAAPAPRGREVVLAASTGLATSLVFLVRQPGSALDSPWAEDGGVFLSGAYRGGWSTLLTPYAGYLHVYSRLAALLASHVTVRDAADVMAVAGVLPPGLVAATVVLATSGWIRALELRVVLGVCLVLFPFGASEIAADVANSHWFFLAGAAVTLAWRTRWRPATGWAVALALLAALTDPLAGLLVPVALVRLLAGPAPRDPPDVGRTCRWTAPVAPVAALVSGLALQATPVSATFGATRTIATLHPGPGPTAREFLRRVPATVLLGETGARPAGVALLVATGVVVVLAVAVVAVRRPVVLPAVLTAVGYVVVFWIVPVRLRGASQDAATTLPVLLRNARYATVSVVLLLVVLFIALDALVGVRHRRVGPLVAVAALAWVLVVQLPSLDTGVVREPSWHAGLVVARARCRATGVRAVQVPISPVRWSTRVPCDRLR